MAAPRGRGGFKPSGRQFRLQWADQVATVTEVGASLRNFRVGETELLDGYGENQRCSDGRGQLFAPWPNRIASGRYQFGGVWHQLPLSEPERGNSIHGLVRWLPWTVEDVSDQAVQLAVTIFPQPGYEFAALVRVRYRLGETGLAVAVEGANCGDNPLPFGFGAHPYLSLGSDRVDDLWVAMPARSRLRLDDRGIPTGERDPVAGEAFDFRSGRVLGDTRLDTAFTDLDRDPDGLAWVRVRRAGDPGELALWLDPGMPFLMLFTGDRLPDPRRRRRGLGVEPMSCPPNAFSSADGVAVVQPAESFRCAWGLRWRPFGADARSPRPGPGSA